jgi:hypothetical protein
MMRVEGLDLGVLEYASFMSLGILCAAACVL